MVLLSIMLGASIYTQGQLLALLPSGSLHTGGYVNALSRFIATGSTLLRGLQPAGIDATVSTINTDLMRVTFVTGTRTTLDPYLHTPISTSLQATLSGSEGTLNNYNSAAAWVAVRRAG